MVEAFTVNGGDEGIKVLMVKLVLKADIGIDVEESLVRVANLMWQSIARILVLLLT